MIPNKEIKEKYDYKNIDDYQVPSTDSFDNVPAHELMVHIYFHDPTHIC